MNFLKIAENYYSEMLSFIEQISVIPAPSGDEDERAEFVKKYMEKLGAKSPHIDGAKNVIYTVEGESEDIVLFMAHTDIVFSGEVKLTYIDTGDKILCPGITDDVACLAVMLGGMKYILDNNIKPKHTLMFVANSCEEGLGNLKGARQIFTDYGDKIKFMYTFDGYYDRVVNRSVGSHRYEITAITEGGHSYNAFGNNNAINVLANIITSIYKIEVPKIGESKTTYNVGTISGGTSVNTIAQNAVMLAEYRSDNVECLDIMKEKFAEIFNNAKATCPDLKIVLVGERPCMKGVDGEKQARLSDFVLEIQRKYSGTEVLTNSGSTDANIPLSLGIPSICVGVCTGGKPHTLEEWLEKESIKKGLAIALELILNTEII